MSEKKIIFPQSISNTLVDTGKSCNLGCCAVFECRPQGPNDLPTTIEVPYEGLDKMLENKTIGIACPEFSGKGRCNLCQITQQPCPNFQIK